MERVKIVVMNGATCPIPLDPVEFRDACIEFAHCSSERMEEDPDYDAYEMQSQFFTSHYGALDPRAEAATVRFRAIAKLMAKRDLSPFQRDVNREVIRVHDSVLESAAVVSFNTEGGFTKWDIIGEASKRAQEIDAVIVLLEDE